MMLPNKSTIQPYITRLGAVLPISLRKVGSYYQIANSPDWEILLGVSLDEDSAKVIRRKVEGEMVCLSAKEPATTNQEFLEESSMDQEIPLVLQQGRFWIRVCGDMYRRVGGELVFQGLVQQITRYKRREEKLKATLVAQKKENVVGANFINYAVHEFKGPLATIFSSLDILNQYEGLHEGENGELPYFRGHFRKIRKHLKIMNAFLDEMVLLSKGGDGGKKEVFLLTAYVREFVQRLDLPSMKNRRISLHLPEADREVRLNKMLLEHILRNLISNAFKYSSGKRSPELVLRIREQSFTFLVRDYGIGIPEKEQGNLFQLPYRGSNAKGIAGTGMGLLIVRDFAECLGGQISFRSRDGEGTTFKLQLPVEQPESIPLQY